ncbi:MAG: helix-hairpin-helix domain-containing protein [Lachnospiraceae bacterium]|nr:helix-hairpin-helix domain-containing protein [Lachnospiraceae bacterium]
MKIKYMIMALLLLLQTVFLSACAAPSPRAVLQDAVSGQEAQEQPAAEPEGYSDEIGENVAGQQEDIYVHICGAVQSPGVYALPEGSRLYEAVDAAGGFLPDACQDYCNLALTVSDGMQYQIPTEDEALSGNLPEVMQENLSSYDNQGLLNINLATAAELMSLPGIGQTRADAIITYREQHGAFACKEDIMQVTGIKDAVYEKIESYIIVR